MSKTEYFIFTVIGPAVSCLIGMWFGANYFQAESEEKEYPVEVHVLWPENQMEMEHTHKFEADSVKADTVYKDGLSIVNHNIINVVFK
jgi:hypothetical protein